MEQFLTSLVLSNQKGYRLGRHLLFWAICVLFFGTIYGPMLRTSGKEEVLIFNPPAFLEALFFLPAHIFLSYAIIYFLFPQYLFTGHYFKLFAGIVALIIITAFISVLISTFVITPYREALLVVPPSNTIIFGIMAGLRGSNTVAGFAAAIKLIKYLYFKQNENEQLEKEKLKAELELLKAQLQPHFLFNTLNNLYSLILQKSDEAPKVVLKLSELLRYILAESNGSKITLTRELGLLKDYIALEQLRCNQKLDLTLNIQGDFEKKMIAPLVLLPFVENSFKHGIHENLDQPWISLDVAVKGNQLKFKLINGKTTTRNGHAPFSTGIGLRNVRKRLDMLYPARYELRTLEEDENFVVNLQLELETE